MKIHLGYPQTSTFNYELSTIESSVYWVPAHSQLEGGNHGISV